MKILLLVTAFSISALAYVKAEELLMEAKAVPDLAASVAKHRSALLALETQKEAALDVPRKSYLTSLVAAPASEAKGGRPSVLKTINEEAEALKGGGIPLGIPRHSPTRGRS